MISIMAKDNLRKDFYSCLRDPVRNLEAETKAEYFWIAYSVGLHSLAILVTSHTHLPRNNVAHSELGPPTSSWALPHQSLIKNLFIVLSTMQYDGSIFSIDVAAPR